jgi:type IV secretory pathway protease TraF
VTLRDSIFAACAALSVAALHSANPRSTVRVIYNASDSMPRDRYLAGLPAVPVVGRPVLLRLPADAVACVAKRRYLPADVPMLKRVAVVATRSVSPCEGVLRTDGAPGGLVRLHDGEHRTLDAWTQRRRLRQDEVFAFGTRERCLFTSFIRSRRSAFACSRSAAPASMPRGLRSDTFTGSR